MAEKDKTPSELAQMHIPVRLFRLYAIATLVLIPWMVLLSYKLPSTHKVKMWDITWIGFDIGLTVALGLTAYWGLKKSGWVIVASSITGTFLLVDAWFDCLTAGPGWHFGLALATAILFEVPIAVVSYWISFETGRRYFKKV